jgi:hypothetical protein
MGLQQGGEMGAGEVLKGTSSKFVSLSFQIGCSHILALNTYGIILFVAYEF